MQDEGPSGFVWVDPVTGEREHRPGSGVTSGSGTSSDPYVIEGWCIEFPGIELQNTQAHVVLQANTVGGLGFLPGDAALRVEDAGNVSMTDNRLADAGFGIGVWRSQGVQASGNLLQDNQKYGIWVAESDEVFIEKNIVEGNDQGIGIGRVPGATVSDNAVVGNRIGILNAFSDEAEIRSNQVVDNTEGIYVREASDVQVVGNRVANHTGTGIAFDLSPRGTLQDNHVAYSGREGIIFWGSPHGAAMNNTATGNGYKDDRYAIRMANSGMSRAVNNTVMGNTNGMVFDGSGEGLARGNALVDNTGHGLMLWDAPESVVQYNKVTGNGIGAAVVDEATGVTLFGNNLYDNRDGEALDADRADGGTVEASGNWWGCPEGPEHEACDHVAGDADYSQWLDEPHPDAP